VLREAGEAEEPTQAVPAFVTGGGGGTSSGSSSSAGGGGPHVSSSSSYSGGATVPQSSSSYSSSLSGSSLPGPIPSSSSSSSGSNNSSGSGSNPSFGSLGSLNYGSAGIVSAGASWTGGASGGSGTGAGASSGGGNTGSISGQIICEGASNTEVWGAPITLTGPNGTTTVTDIYGSYTFTGLAAGDYSVSVYGGLLFGFGGLDLTLISPSPLAVTLSAGEASTGNDFTYGASFEYSAYSISGMVTDVGTGTPLENVTITLGTGAGVQITTASTDSTGNYSFIGLEPNDYSVIAPLTLGNEVLITEQSIDVDLGSSDSTGNNFSYMASIAPVSSSSSLAGSAPISSSSLPSGSGSGSANSSSASGFSMGSLSYASVGTVSSTASWTGGGSSLSGTGGGTGQSSNSGTGGGTGPTSSSSSQVTTGNGSSSGSSPSGNSSGSISGAFPSDSSTSAGPGSISGALLDEMTGLGLGPNIQVILYSSTGAVLQTTYTDITGAYIFASLAQANYFVTAPYNAAGETLVSGSPLSAVLSAGAQYTDYDFYYNATSAGSGSSSSASGTSTGLISGTVFIDNDVFLSPVSDVLINLVGSFNTASLYTDVNGNYSFTGLLPDTYYVWAPFSIENSTLWTLNPLIIILASGGISTGNDFVYGPDIISSSSGSTSSGSSGVTSSSGFGSSSASSGSSSSLSAPILLRVTANNLLGTLIFVDDSVSNTAQIVANVTNLPQSLVNSSNYNWTWSYNTVQWSPDGVTPYVAWPGQFPTIETMDWLIDPLVPQSTPLPTSTQCYGTLDGDFTTPGYYHAQAVATITFTDGASPPNTIATFSNHNSPPGPNDQTDENDYIGQ